MAVELVLGPLGTASPSGLIESDDVFLWLWPRRNAVEDGGGSGSTCSSSEGGEDVFLGGEKERAFVGVCLSVAGGETLTLGVGG